MGRLVSSGDNIYFAVLMILVGIGGVWISICADVTKYPLRQRTLPAPPTMAMRVLYVITSIIVIAFGIGHLIKSLH